MDRPNPGSTSAVESEQSVLRWPSLTWLGLACLCFELAAISAYLADNIFLLTTFLLLSGIPFALAVYRCFRATIFGKGCLAVILIFAVVARLLLVPLDPPRLSTDLYRYLWDGRVQRAGFSPYAYIPADQHLALLRDPQIYPKINRKDYAPTIYPPLAELWFYAIACLSNSVCWFKAAMALIDLTTVAALVRLLAVLHLPRERVLVYAWHPLPIWEFASAGHIDSVMILFLVLAFLARAENEPVAAGLALGCAMVTKFIPLLLFPVLYRKRDWKMPISAGLIVALLYLIYFVGVGSKVLGFLPSYAREERLQTGERYYFLNLLNHLLHWSGLPFRIPPLVFIVSALMGLGALAFRAFLKINWKLGTPDPTGPSSEKAFEPIIAQNTMMLRQAFLLVLAFTALLSFDYPWYNAWLVPFLVFVPSAAGLFVTLSCFVLYRAIHEYTRQNYFMLHSQIWLPFLVLLGLGIWRLGNDQRAERLERLKGDE